jgi:hypothetical protein
VLGIKVASGRSQQGSMHEEARPWQDGQVAAASHAPSLADG